jgi:hypothetical protein
MSQVFRSEAHAELVRRIDSLRPESVRQWGRMSPHQAVCHLNDSYKAILLDRPLARESPDLKRLFMRFYAFTLPIPWPKGAPTSREVDAERDGSPPGDFEADVEELKTLLQRFVDSEGRTLEPHYYWGQMPRRVWGRYGYRHIDHHLRQFGA